MAGLPPTGRDSELPSGWARTVPTAEQLAHYAATHTPERMQATLLSSPSLTLRFVHPGYINYLPVLQCIQRWWRKLRALWRDPVQ